MIPQGGVLKEEEAGVAVEQTSRTYRLDLRQKRVIGMVDGQAAIEQAVYKILQTDRFDHLIYSADYGVEYGGLAGANQAFLQSELRRRIREALLQDDRIIAVEEMRFSFQPGSALVEFIVESNYGDIQIKKEVVERV